MKWRWFVVVLALWCLGTGWPGLPPEEDLDGLSATAGISEHFTVLGQDMSWEVTEKDVAPTPAWLDPKNEEPPLSIAAAVAISEPQLVRYLPEISEWRLEQVTLHRLGWESRWFYVVEWKVKRHHEGDFIGIPVLMSGQAVYLEMKTSE